MRTSAGLSVLISLIVPMAAVAASAQPIDNRGSTGLEESEFHKPALG